MVGFPLDPDHSACHLLNKNTSGGNAQADAQAVHCKDPPVCRPEDFTRRDFLKSSVLSLPAYVVELLRAKVVWVEALWKRKMIEIGACLMFKTAFVREVKLGSSLAGSMSTSNRDKVLAAVRKRGCRLQWHEEHLGDHEIVLEAVKQDGLALQHASSSCKRDRAIVLAAVKQNGFALQYAAESCRSDCEV
eukprot:4400426-Amphidinium_carterae.1